MQYLEFASELLISEPHEVEGTGGDDQIELGTKCALSLFEINPHSLIIQTWNDHFSRRFGLGHVTHATQ
jgi:hypothetical protein